MTSTWQISDLAAHVAGHRDGQGADGGQLVDYHDYGHGGVFGAGAGAFSEPVACRSR